MAVTAAFLTGHPLRVRINGYDELQSSLIEALRGLDGQGWSVNGQQWRQDGTFNSGGGFTSTLPLVIVRREGRALLDCARAALRGRPDDEHAWYGEQTQGWDVVLDSVRIDVYDLGMAVMNATFLVRPPAGLSLAAMARIMKRSVWLKPDAASGCYSPIAAAFRELASETTQQFATAVRAVAPDAVQDAWLAPFLEALPVNETADRPLPTDWGRLLWLHPVYIAAVDGGDEDRAAYAKQLAPAFHRTIDIPDGLFVPGIGWSAIVTNGEVAEAEIPLRLIELHWAYSALYMEIDRGLLALLDDDRWRGSESIAELEKDADRVFGDYMLVMEARARLDSALASLGGDELAMWEVIADVSKFDPLVEGVDRKVETLQRVAERRVQQAEASRGRRTSRILSGLTALTLVTVAVALIGNFLGSRSDTLGHVGLRVALVAAALIASVALYREVHREKVRGPREPAAVESVRRRRA